MVQEFQRLRARRPTRLSLPSIVARYIEYIDPILRLAATSTPTETKIENALNEAISAVFEDQVMEFLAAKGYSVEDVVSWAWILTSRQSRVAVMRWMVLENNTRDCASGGVDSSLPTFILSFTLRRQHIEPEALRMLLWFAARALGKDPYDPSNAKPENIDNPGGKSAQASSLLSSGDYSTTMIIFVRLIRVAAKVLPTALPYIAELFTSVFGSAALAENPGKCAEKRLRHYTTLYNKCLSLLARPCDTEPYHSIALQQRAIFHLLGEMTTFTPVLAVTREGYQGIVRVQAARRKSPAEKEWADFKAKSWPPWKEDKLGIDAESENEGMLSKTMQALRHMTEAGYGMTVWERVARIVSGWDIDGTPTIQTRTLLPRPSLFRKRRLQASMVSESQAMVVYLDPVIWQARIRATRTVKEAWACFVSYREYKIKPDKYVHFEMMQKLVFGENHRKSGPFAASRPSDALPGDGKEVYPEPSSPRDVIYVKSEPPAPNEFLHQMFVENIGVSRTTLVLVLNYTDSFNSGMMCLWRSDLSESQIHSLGHIGVNSGPDRQDHICEIPDNIFAAFIGFLCRFYQPRTKDSTLRWKHIFPILFSTGAHRGRDDTLEPPVVSERALSHAVFLMRMRMSHYLPAWYQLISALQQTRAFHRPYLLPIPLQQVLAWREITEVLRWMGEIDLQIDMQGFELLCKYFVRALQAYQRHEELTMKGFWRIQENGFGPNILSENPCHSVMAVLDTGLRLLEDRFYQTVSPREPGDMLLKTAEPSHGFLRSPLSPTSTLSPHALHSFIRALGYAEDHDGLMELLRWMKKSDVALQASVENRMSGKLHLRLCVVALRVFLEGFKDQTFQDVEERYTNSLAAPEESDEDTPLLPSVQEAYAIIEGSELLSPWPSIEEVYNYRRKMYHWIPLY